MPREVAAGGKHREFTQWVDSKARQTKGSEWGVTHALSKLLCIIQIRGIYSTWPFLCPLSMGLWECEYAEGTKPPCRSSQQVAFHSDEYQEPVQMLPVAISNRSHTNFFERGRSEALKQLALYQPRKVWWKLKPIWLKSSMLVQEEAAFRNMIK